MKNKKIKIKNLINLKTSKLQNRIVCNPQKEKHKVYDICIFLKRLLFLFYIRLPMFLEQFLVEENLDFGTQETKNPGPLTVFFSKFEFLLKFKIL